MKTKDEVFIILSEFKALVKNQQGRGSRCFGSIMKESTPPRSLMLFAFKHGLRGSL
jgi:hypothetical protein